MLVVAANPADKLAISPHLCIQQISSVITLGGMQSLRLLTASVRPRGPALDGPRGTPALQLIKHAGPTRLCASTTVETVRRPYRSASSSTARDYGLLSSAWTSLRARNPTPAPHRARFTTHRSFHATSRRDALPLLPAGLAILKSTSLLTLVTAISRVLISFLPLGGIAAFRASRLNSLLQNPERVPTVSKEAEEFYLTWCQGEKPRSITSDESYKVLDLPVERDGSIVLPDGRAAHAMPDWVGKAFRRQGQGPKDFSPASVRAEPSYAGRLDRQARMQRRVRYIIPPLPDASVRIYDSFPASTRAEIDQLRQYWGFIRLFKDRMRFGRIILFFVLILPCLLLGAAYLAAVERVPLTGRWRIILLTPEEEDAVSSSLAGVNWFKSVINLLTTEEAPAPRVVEHSDWRFRWVNDTLRRLEAGVIAVDPDTPETRRNPAPTVIQPPPSIYPLRPRPRASARLHEALPGGSPDSGREHLALGPPYSLMLMHKDETNAFSYGFGGKGAGGIVVFTGLLDEIMRHNGDVPSTSSTKATASSPPPSPGSQGFMAGIFGGSRQHTPPRNRDPPRPTERQTLHLASVLAHEMGHLLLSHHLETLSQQHVLWPSLLGFSMDLFRAAIWPVTFFLGPAINDALANLGKAGTKELSEKYGHIGFQFKHEYEADLASLRILALANMDPEAALLHFEHSFASLREMQPPEEPQTGILSSLFAAWTATTHPSPEERTARMRAELDEWRKTAQAERM